MGVVDGRWLGEAQVCNYSENFKPVDFSFLQQG